MLIWILIVWIGASFLTALVVGRFISRSDKQGRIAETDWYSKNHSTQVSDSCTSPIQPEEMANEASAL
jgi:hypothetical protein